MLVSVLSYLESSSHLSLFNNVVFSGLALALVLHLLLRQLIGRGRTIYPPSPKGLPIFGNIFQLPSRRHWLKYDEWAKQYGDVFRFTSFGETTIILSSVQAASELLEARGAIYSDRPASTFAGDIVGWNLGLGYARFAPTAPPPTSARAASPTEPWPVHSDMRFRALRKFFHDAIGPRACVNPDLIALQARARSGLLTRLLRTAKEAGEAGADFERPIRQSTAALILLLTYGYEVNDRGYDPLVQIVDDAMVGFSAASDPDAFWVDRWPILRHIPAWCPGAGFHEKARLFRADRKKLYDVPFNHVQQQLRGGTALPSIVSSQISAGPDIDKTRDEFIKAAAASLYSGGADTTPLSLLTFFLVMALYPDVQTRAQHEIDSLLGPASSSADCRLPSIDDYEKLSYIKALVKELWRWNPIVPLGLAHRVTEDDVYRGMFIEKGTTVYANIWSILHDEKTYPSPFVFQPERFLNVDGSTKILAKTEDPGFIAFGFGRRICPGIHLAENSVFLYVASILYLFNISKARDADGREIVPEVDYDGFISHPGPFECRLTTRSGEVEELITRELHGHV
ncbi:cytochrome P450 [Gloeopeniophorella convolvens]|nr:cytochrome P450 [Gloeopeniophorella convolvens]